ncbi:MAG: SDR family oxidoreductase [Betaproteobacteria bacterium]|nr:SDR family oxidoreductase [Betaproteobacteria bacterium]
MKTFENKVAVITGAASGLGRAFADKAATLKMKLVLSDVRDDALQTTLADFRAQGVDVAGIVCDVSKADQVEALAKLAIERFGAVHCLFNNAGVGSGGLVWESTVKDWEWVLNVNLWGVIHGVRLFTPLMLDAAKKDPEYEGHIVNVSSIAGLIAPHLLGTYNVSKHAVVALSESLYHDLAKTEPRIKASVLCPGFTPTGISHSYRNRPDELKNDAAPSDSMMACQMMIEKAVSSGKLTAADVAETTFQAIAEGKFYILTHPKFMPLVKARLEDMAEMRNPRDVFGMKA